MAAVPLDQISPEQKEPIIVTLYRSIGFVWANPYNMVGNQGNSGTFSSHLSV